MRIGLAMSVATLFISMGCSSSGGGGGSAGLPMGIDGTKPVSQATESDKTATCTWYAGLVGGYGATSSCGSAVLNAPPTQADCLSTFPSCEVTFADFAACVVAVVDAQKQCTDTSVKDATMSDACATVLPAGCFGGMN